MVKISDGAAKRQAPSFRLLVAFGPNHSAMPMVAESAEIRSFSHPKTSATVLDVVAAGALAGKRVLDVGAGEGYFSSLLGKRAQAQNLDPRAVVHACDLHPQQFRYPQVDCRAIDAQGRLPYDDESFDAACSIEVVEHLENQFHLARELYRVVKPGGRAVITTPNILNINSRLRALVSGFGLLFNPLPLTGHAAIHASTGHIHPVSFYYLAYMFHRAGFRTVNIHFDRYKSSAIAWLAVTWLPLCLGSMLFRAKFAHKHPDISRENAGLIALINRPAMLCARTVIVEGVK
jgi:2-polyprenyl-3-methyl-5-hydroxy-6-metoxy-1,4-benzoquinol methylase